MADRKITDLTALAAGSQATGDLLTIVDVSEAAAADKNKKITVESLFKGIPGDVGINVSSPASNLHVKGNNIVQYVEATGTAAEICFRNNTSTGDNIRIGGSGNNLTFDTGGSESARIDSSGNLGIGTSSPGHLLTLKGTQAFEATNSTNDWLAYTYTDNTFRLNYNGAGADEVVIDSSGRVGIGTADPQRALVVSDAGTEGFEFYPGSSAGNNTVNHYNRSTASFVNSITTADQHIFGRADGEKMRIDSSGNVGIGVTSPDRKLEVVDTSSSGSYPLAVSNFINATANKGAAIDFRLTTAGNTRGELGCKWDSNSSSDGTYFYVAPNDGTTGNVQKVRIDNDGLKFNSETAAANALEDYEEGTWTPTCASDGNIGSSQYTNTYTKIGRLVTINCDIHALDNITSSNPIKIGGLPFVPSTTSGELGSTAVHGERLGSSLAVAFLQYLDNSWVIRFRKGVGNTNYNDVRHSDLNNASDNNMRFSLTYEITT